jgi:Protein of unknown function (DUF2510)
MMSPTPQQSLPPFGWYPDPTGLPMLRWWTGSAWTEQLEAPRPEIQPAAGYTTSNLGQRDLLAS